MLVCYMQVKKLTLCLSFDVLLPVLHPGFMRIHNLILVYRLYTSWILQLLFHRLLPFVCQICCKLLCNHLLYLTLTFFYSLYGGFIVFSFLPSRYLFPCMVVMFKWVLFWGRFCESCNICLRRVGSYGNITSDLLTDISYFGVLLYHPVYWF